MTSHSSRVHQARKNHRCDTCRRRVGKGELYLRSRCWDGGDVWTFRQCMHCKASVHLYSIEDMDGMISESGFLDWIDSDTRSYEELRAKAGYNSQWRTQAGTLWEVPC